MTATAQQIAADYLRAWLAGDAEKALSFIADDVVCDAPTGHLVGAAAYRQFLEPFVTALHSGEVIDVLADGNHAVTVYVCETPFAKDFRGMEYLTIESGQITQILSVFDLSPGLKARAAADS